MQLFKDKNIEDRLFCNIAAAILGAGALGAAGTAFGASKAADAQTNAANSAVAQQNRMYDSNKNLLMPFITAGQNQLPGLTKWNDYNDSSSPLNALMKLVMPGADMSSTLEQTPGYQFNLNQGLRASSNALAARGLGGSGGAAAKGAASFASGLAGNTWQSVVNALTNTFSTGAGTMQNLVNTGAQSGNALAGVGTNTANANSNALIGSGNAQAAGYNALGSAIGQGGNALGSAYITNQLLGGGNGGNPAYGGNGVYGGSSSNPLAGLDASDYGVGF